MSLEVKAIYIGNDSGYWYKLIELFKKNYNGFILSFSEIATDKNSRSNDLFIQIYEAKAQVVFIDFEYEPKTMMELAKLLNRNNEMRLLSLTGLYSVNQDLSIIDMGVAASIRLNHIKSSIEFEDTVYDAVSLLDVNLAEPPEYVRSEKELVFEILQPLRIGYIEENRFHVETNSYLEEGQIVDVHDHPLMKIMPSTKVYVEKFYEKNLYYNRRFGYDLEFIYIDNDFFAATNENWKLYKSLKDSPEGLEKLDPEKQDEVLKDMKARKEKYSEIKYLIDRWMKDKESKRFSKRLKIMIVDETLNILRSLDKANIKVPYSINFQTMLLSDFYQIKRSMPHLIAMKVSESNTIETLEEMIKKIKSIEDYHPFILLFNSEASTDELRKKVDFKQLMARKEEEIEIQTLVAMARALDDKLDISSTDGSARVFFKSNEPESFMYLKKFVKIYKMTESELYLYSQTPIPLWTVFKVHRPVNVLLTIVPHLEKSGFANQEGYYRCLINGTGEAEKAALRRVINSTLKEEEQEDNESSES